MWGGEQALWWWLDLLKQISHFFTVKVFWTFRWTRTFLDLSRCDYIYMCGSEALVCLPVPQGLWAATGSREHSNGGDNRGGDKWKLSSSTPNFVGIRTKNRALIRVPPATNNNGPKRLTSRSSSCCPDWVWTLKLKLLFGQQFVRPVRKRVPYKPFLYIHRGGGGWLKTAWESRNKGDTSLSDT